MRHRQGSLKLDLAGVRLCQARAVLLSDCSGSTRQLWHKHVVHSTLVCRKMRTHGGRIASQAPHKHNCVLCARDLFSYLLNWERSHVNVSKNICFCSFQFQNISTGMVNILTAFQDLHVHMYSRVLLLLVYKYKSLRVKSDINNNSNHLGSLAKFCDCNSRTHTIDIGD